MKLEFQSKIGRVIELTQERQKHIFEFHPDVNPYFSRIEQVLEAPSEIRSSRHNPEVLLFYKYFADIKSGKYLAVVVKTNQRNFILTCYLTDKIITGQKIYEQRKQSN